MDRFSTAHILYQIIQVLSIGFSKKTKEVSFFYFLPIFLNLNRKNLLILTNKCIKKSGQCPLFGQQQFPGRELPQPQLSEQPHSLSSLFTNKQIIITATMITHRELLFPQLPNSISITSLPLYAQ